MIISQNKTSSLLPQVFRGRHFDDNALKRREKDSGLSRRLSFVHGSRWTGVWNSHFTRITSCHYSIIREIGRVPALFGTLIERRRGLCPRRSCMNVRCTCAQTRANFHYVETVAEKFAKPTPRIPFAPSYSRGPLYIRNIFSRNDLEVSRAGEEGYIQMEFHLRCCGE